MRLDPDHVEKIRRAFTPAGEVKIDIDFMTHAMERLSLWERGLLAQSLLKAAAAKRRSPEQRILLAMFAHAEGGEHE